MSFRPCIDIHNGKVKQIVGATLSEDSEKAKENFVSEKDAASFALLYKKDGLKGGHVILLNKAGAEGFEETKAAAVSALKAYPGGLQIGGGINEDNAQFYLDAGASHVIVTSYVFSDGKIDYKRLKSLSDKVGKDRLVLDLSCRKKGNEYFIVTDRWTKYTEETVSLELLEKLYTYCDEFLIHAADVEGKCNGVEENLVRILSGWDKCPMTYAGGITSFADIKLIESLGEGNLSYTIGSALDIFGGSLPYEKVVKESRSSH